MQSGPKNQRATDLIEHGFQYVTEMDGVKLFRKRKKTKMKT
jgi:hypothetical protein